MDSAPPHREDLPTLQVAPVGRAQVAAQELALIAMHTDSTPKRITRLTFKCEGENADGMAIGMLTDQDAKPVVPGGHWVTKQEALRIARDLRVELADY